MNVGQAFKKFEDILENIMPDHLTTFVHRVYDRIKEIESKDKDADRSKDEVLENIRESLRHSLPLTAVTNTETVMHPTVGPNSKMDPKTTIHVDAFLYDDELFDKLCDDGTLSRNYCAACGSHDIRPLTVLTHSASVAQIKYMFKYLVPSLGGKTVLDIGSRTGAVLYGAYLYSNCRNIIGVEIDPTFCKLQQEIIANYGFDDRIKVFHQNILDNADLISSSDIVIMNNVFEFFLTKELQERMWKVLSKALRKSGKILITIPSVEESLENLDILDEVNMDWLKPVELHTQREMAKRILFGDDVDNDELDSMFMYRT